MADLEFLRDTRVVCMVSLAPPAEEEEKGEVNEGEEGGPGPPWDVSFPLSFYCSFSFLFFLADFGTKEIRAPYSDGYSGLGQDRVYL